VHNADGGGADQEELGTKIHGSAPCSCWCAPSSWRCGCAWRVVFMIVERDLQMPAECGRDAAQGPEARYVIATLEARDHRLGHAQTNRQLLLCLTHARAQAQASLRAHCAAMATPSLARAIPVPDRPVAVAKHTAIGVAAWICPSCRPGRLRPSIGVDVRRSGWPIRRARAQIARIRPDCRQSGSF
jgi:hypothetical protein